MNVSSSTLKRCPNYRAGAKLVVVLLIAIGLSGCASLKAPKLKTPQALKKLSLPSFSLPENDPSFKKRLYAGASFGSSTLKPDTSATVFTVASDKSTSTQLRLGIDLHNKFSVELDTAVLGQSDLAQAGTSVSYTSASVSTLIYGLTGVRNRSLRQGWSGYGRIGYSLIQKASQVIPLDKSESGIILGLGGEYGFKNGLGLRGELIRYSSDASGISFGGIYRFGQPPEQIGRIFVNAAKPALKGGNTKVAAGGRMLSGVNESAAAVSAGRGDAHPTLIQSMGFKRWNPEPSEQDVDGDGVKNELDNCADSTPDITADKEGCGLFNAVLDDVTFKPGSTWLTPKSRGSLDSLAVILLAFPEARIQVQAHTDNNGPADANLGLSARRAESVVTYLVEKGVADMQLETLGLGESQPIASNDTKEGRQRNRRVEILTLPNISDEALQGDAEEIELTKATLSAELIEKAANAPKAANASVAKKTIAKNETVLPPMQGVQIQALPKSAVVSGLSLGGILDGVDFKDGSASLTSASKKQLISVSEQMQAHPSVALVVMAHTDDQRPAEESLTLSAKRANSVVNHLVSLGVDATRLSAEGYGSSLPLAQNLTDADRKRNQRIEVRVVE